MVLEHWAFWVFLANYLIMAFVAFSSMWRVKRLSEDARYQLKADAFNAAVAEEKDALLRQLDASLQLNQAELQEERTLRMAAEKALEELRSAVGAKSPSLPEHLKDSIVEDLYNL